MPDKKRIEPKPIDLTFFEDQFLEIPEVSHSQGFGAWVQVQSQQNGKVVQSNLWETANPKGQWGGDGFLSYDEAKGKTFAIPMAFCNSPGTIYVDVNDQQGFETLRGFLGAPIRTHLFSIHSCYEKKNEVNPSSPDRLPDPDSMNEMLASIQSSTDDSPAVTFGQELMQNMLESGVSSFVAQVAQSSTGVSIEQGLKVAFEGASTSIGQMLVNPAEPAVDCEGDEDCEAWLRGEDVWGDN